MAFSRLIAAGVGLAALATLPAIASGANNKAIFEQRIAPVSKSHCAECHSGGQPVGELDLSTLDGVLAGGRRGVAIVHGHASESLLINYVRDENLSQTPLGGALPEQEVDGLANALDAMEPPEPAATAPVAAWPFNPPVRPVPPNAAECDWPQNPLDTFVLARLAANGLEPAPPMSRRTLVRRVHFNLTGLPPLLEEIDSFLSDAHSGAYGRMVERVLAKPEHGERWGLHWHDLAHFAESDSFAINRERPTAWRYHDYVFRAFNCDKPHERFVQEQIADDEPDSGPAGSASDRIVAFGILRMGPWEQDAILKKKPRQDFLDEVTSVVGSVFLGMTVGYAQCHEHKYNPIPQRDFYRLRAFLAATRVDELRLTYRHPGRDWRLTDTGGRLIQKVVA